MNRRYLVITLLFVCLSAQVAVAAPKQKAENTPEEHLREGWKTAASLHEGTFSESQKHELNSIAYSAAVSNLCEGFELDRSRFAEGMKKLEHQDLVSMSPEEKVYFEHQLMFHYGVAVGMFLAEGSLHPEQFCTAAAKHRDENSKHSFWKNADNESKQIAGSQQ